MAVTQKNTPPPAPAKSPKIGAHTHQCFRMNHQWDCQYTTKCQLEMIPGAQKYLDEMCPGCHMLAFGQYAS